MIIQGTENTGKNMLRPSSCSGVTTADMMMIIHDHNANALKQINGMHCSNIEFCKCPEKQNKNNNLRLVVSSGRLR